jgi:hypothetical protein
VISPLPSRSNLRKALSTIACLLALHDPCVAKIIG